jgi:hypothetical protein
MLSVNNFSVFSEYMSILLFICLPFIVLASGLAVWLHYRQKRRKNDAAVSAITTDDISFSVNGSATQLVTLSPLANEDKFNLIKECRKQLTKSRAKFFALKHDLTKSESYPVRPGNYNSHMENLHEKAAAYEKQIADLQSKLEVLETVIPAQDEAYFLRQALRERDVEIARLKNAVSQYNSENQLLQLKTAIAQKDSELLRVTELLSAKLVQLTNTQRLLAEVQAQSSMLNHSYATSNIQLIN